MADLQVQANDEQEIAEAQNSLTDLLYDVVAQAATTRLGAFVYRRIDSVLSTVEKTAKWSLPQPAPTAAPAPAPAPPAPAQEGAPAPAEGDPNPNPNPDANNAGTGKISAPPLIRPLPWMLFLPALVVMRMVRIGLSLLALMVGRPPVTPTLVVYFIQNKRRKLRALKYRGQKLNRISRAEAKAEDELQTTWLSRITMPLRRIVCRPGRVVVTPHRHHHHRHQAQRQQNQQQQNQHQQQQQQQQQQDQQPGRKRNAHECDIDDDSEVDESTVNELLDKYADADGDSSYHADSGSSDSSDTSLSEQEKSAVEDGPSKKQPPAEPSSSTAKKESNGHGPKEGSQARRKSDLNVEADPKPKPAENGSVDGAKKQDATKEPTIKELEKAESKDAKPKATENGPSDGSKNQDAAKEERQKSESNKPKPNPPASGSESTDSKQTNAAGQKNQQEEDAAKNQSMSDVKQNFQQKNKQQQQQQQNQPQNQPQHANANGASAGKKQKRPSQGHQ